MSILALLTFTAAALLAGLLAGALLNRKAYEGRRELAIAELFAAVDTLPTYFRAEDIVELPEAVQHYLRRNLNEGAPHQSCMRLLEAGSVRQQYGQPWTEFAGEGYLSVAPAASVWFRRLRPLPLVWLDELRTLRPGQAQFGAKLLSSITSLDEQGPRARQRALLSYLAHAPLLPGVLLPGDDRGWAGIPRSGETDEDGDTLMRDDAARFWLRDGDIEVTGVFEFDELGNIVRLWTDEHPLDLRLLGQAKQGEVARWVVDYAEHRSFGNSEDLFLPTKLNLEWQLGDERIAYLDKTIVDWRVDVPRSWTRDPG